jgi:glycosyltransferase involved in cell wall biosynthesis
VNRSSLTISVVIPVYNEARHINACLSAIQNQTQPVDEIIVVDNNCTDDTIHRAKQHTGISIVTESRQGITFARTAGFDAARSGIIARIDADTIVSPEWAETIRHEFSRRTGAPVAAIAGGASIQEISPKDKFWMSCYYRAFRFWHERSIGVSPMLYGFNSALKREVWQEIREQVHLGDDKFSEDVDLTITLLKAGARIHRSENMMVKCHLFRSFDSKKLKQYYQTDSHTLDAHGYGNPKRWATLD